MNVSIKARLIFTVLLMIGITLIIYYVGYSALSSVNDDLNRISDQTAEEIRLSATINQDILFIARGEKELILANTDRKMKDIIDRNERREAQMNSRINELEKIVEGEGKIALTEFKTRWNEYKAVYSEIRDLTLQNTNAKATELSMGKASKNYERAYSLLIKITEDANRNSSIPQLNAAYSLLNNMGNIQSAEKNIILSETVEEMHKIEEEILNYTESANDNLRALERIYNDQLLKDFSSFYNKYIDLNEEIRSLTKMNTNSKAEELSENEARVQHDEAFDFLTQIVNRNNQQLAADKIESDQTYEQASTNMIIVLIIGVLLACAIAYWIINSISSSLNRAKQVVTKLAEGDFTVDITVRNKDEIGELLMHMNRMVTKLKDIIQSVVQGTNNIASASEQVSSTSQQLSQGATEQASSVEEVSSSMEQMSSNIEQNTDNAKQTEGIAISAARGMEEGNASVAKTVVSMRDIAEKISIIGEISRRTNLLALNAAVEAARAGEHGKGFAVVAAEVRKLAERSEQAAAEIDETSKSSVEIAEKSGTLLAEIVPEIQKTSKLVQEISAASNEQSSGAEQINSAIQQLNQVVQQNAAGSEELASSAEELTAQAISMAELVSFFKIGDSGSNSFNQSYSKKRANSAFKEKSTLHEDNGNSRASTKNSVVDIKLDNSETGDFEEF